MRQTPDPHKRYDVRDMYDSIEEGRITKHEFVDWFVNRQVDLAMEIVDKEREFQKQMSKTKFNPWAQPC